VRQKLEARKQGLNYGSIAMRILSCIFGVLLSWLAPFGAAQSTITPEQALARVLKQTPAQAAWFAPDFLAQIPVTQIDAVVKQYRDTLGAFERAEATTDGFTVMMERGTAPAKIHLDAEGRIDGLWFGVPQLAQPASLEDTMKDLGALPGKVSALVLEDEKPLAALHENDALAVGSAFKLAILEAAAERTASGKLRLDGTFALKKEWKSLPSGVLQSWPEGTPLTLATLENEMISISDNTAADAMLAIVGREQVEKIASRNKPFLSTREAFVLKAKGNEAMLERFRKADENGRQAMLDQIDARPVPAASQFGEAPTATDVEWFFTADELCAMISKTADMAAFRINPGLADAAQWQTIAFKGGSEGGVLNLTTALTGKNGRHYCVAATWNNTSALDQAKFFAIYAKFFGALARR
jgi:beta-lactamase class A